MVSGSFHENRCRGTTGLIYIAEDVVEYAGYVFFDNNYLSPINVSAGTILYIAIYNASNDESKYKIISRGSATLRCNEVHEELSLSLFPNPTAGTLILDGGKLLNAKVGIEVYDNDGKVHIRQSIDSNEPIDISFLPSGVYIIKIHNDGQLISSQRIINMK